MQRSSRLIDQPTDLFPFNQETYDRVTFEFEKIERRFRALKGRGNPYAKDLANKSARINGLIYELWSAVVGAEEQERKSEIADTR